MRRSFRMKFLSYMEISNKKPEFNAIKVLRPNNEGLSLYLLKLQVEDLISIVSQIVSCTIHHKISLIIVIELGEQPESINKGIPY